MGRKRIKATIKDFPVSYYDFKRVNYSGNYGILYKLERCLTDSEKEELMKFKNVHIVGLHCLYAPEIRKTAVVLFDKCIK